ncbi:MAG: YcjX family protein [Halopseudomonas sp.]|uniref:YcjX family protein n=1 Tax=Halopseudomonas sp. TaxID=2901191 RepID=UPI00300120EF
MANKSANWFKQVGQTSNPLRQRRLRIGVTGLSGAGKTTFITGLINQLENHRKGLLAQRAPFDRLESVRWRRDDVKRPFPYLQSLAALSATPAAWPDSTADLSRVLLDLRFKPQGLLGRLQKGKELSIEILDYPGEWLLDLPLLNLSYGQWCEQMAQWLGQPPRAELAGVLARRLGEIDPVAPADPILLAELAAEWTDFLQRCRSEAGLSRNQPARFLQPGSDVAAQMLHFVPLLQANQHTAGAADSWWALCESRFNYYRDFIVRGFYDEHFRHLDQQVLLVDMLAPMDAGQAALQDLKHAMEAVLESFHYGQNGFLARLLRFRPRIRRLALCATKVDKVGPRQQRAVQQCLEDLMVDRLADVRHGGVEIKGIPLSAIRATRQEGEALVAGLEGKTGWVRYQPGDIPEHLPQSLQVSSPELLPLRPPPGLHRNEPFPHYRMDDLVAWLLQGERL